MTGSAADGGTKAREQKSKARGNGQGSVYKLGPNKYRWQCTVGLKLDGKPIRRSGIALTSKAAHEAMSAAKTDHARGLVSASPESVTVAEFAERWLSRQTNARGRSLILYRSELSYALEHIGKLRVKDVKARHLKDLLVALAAREMKGGRGKNKPMAQRTQNKVVMRLRALFREAVSDQIIYVSPMDGVKKTSSPEPEPAGTVLDFHEAARFQELGWLLFQAGICRMFPVLFTALSVGLRRGEVMGLTWDCVDFDRGVLKVRKSLNMAKGGAVLGDVKTKGSKRDIHMPASLVAALKEHKARQDEHREQMGTEWRGIGAVFCTAHGEFISPDNMKRALSTVLGWSDPRKAEAIGRKGTPIPKELQEKLRAAIVAGEKLPDLSPHDLRHTYATLALRLKTPLEVVSKTLGHANITITLNTYRHVLDSERRENVVDLFAVPVPQRQIGTAVLN